ncbi:MAG TPA: TRAP transporter small permease [Tepidimicrobium sp.]|nr:TRAP transporter small permease [Tepidimicrobium sp.]
MCVVFMQTLTRHVIFYSLPWSEELSRYLFVIMIMLGINIAVSKDMMVRIDMIDNVLSEKGKRAFEIGGNIIALLIATIFFYSSIDLVSNGLVQKSSAMQISMSTIYIFVSLGFFFTMLSIVFKIIEIVKEK